MKTQTPHSNIIDRRLSTSISVHGSTDERP